MTNCGKIPTYSSRIKWIFKSRCFSSLSKSRSNENVVCEGKKYQDYNNNINCNNNNTNNLIRVTETFGKTVGIQFGLQKCATAVKKKENLQT